MLGVEPSEKKKEEIDYIYFFKTQAAIYNHHLLIRENILTPQKWGNFNLRIKNAPFNWIHLAF